MYPLNILQSQDRVYPLFGGFLEGEPYIFDFSSKNEQSLDYETRNYSDFQSGILQELHLSGKKWGVGRYLEERGALLRHYPQMIEEGRIYHAGLDVTSPAGTPLFSPIKATVLSTGIDEGKGNYGGYVLLRHEVLGGVFYSFYGHLHSDHLVSVDDKLLAGDKFALLGEEDDSGGWFSHVHLQVHTEKSINENRLLQGYVTKESIMDIDEYFPSPYPLFRW